MNMKNPMKMNLAFTLIMSAAICPMATMAAAGNDIAIEADGHRSIQTARPVKPGDETMTFTQRFGLEWLPVDSVILPGMNHRELLKEDEGFDPRPLRFAVPRNFSVEAADGRWVKVPGGWLWRLQIQSEGAENIRGHIADMDLPKNAEIKIHAPSMPMDIAGPYRETGPRKTGEAWGFTAPGDHFIVEYFTPYEPVDVLPFAIDELYHGYRDIFVHDNAEEEPQGGVAGAGSCHNDPACYSDWSDVSDATCRLFFQGYVCSAQLTATTTADETPLVTTANHCISTASEAASCEFRFRYRRTNCGSGLSNGVASNGADLLDTYSASDSTLLMIDDELPSGIFFVGWTTAALGNGTDVVCLHHPAGDYQRISFGDKISSGICGSSSYWHGAQWNDGVTEGGSSGSALYRDSDQKLTSVLTCGASSCSNQNGGDGYGRFDRAYSNGGFSAFMQAGSDDSLEDGDSCENAVELEPGSYNNLVVKSTDEDWYTFDVANGTDIDVFLDFVDGNGDIDAQLFDSCGSSYLVNSTSNNNDESFTYTNNTGVSQTYFLRVFLFSDTRNDYSMTIDYTPGSSDPPPANDLCENAIEISNGTTPYTTNAASANGPDVPIGCSSSNGPATYSDVWFNYTASCTGFVEFNACDADFDNRIMVYQDSNSCPNNGTAVAGCADDVCGVQTSVSVLALEGQTFKVRIGSPINASGNGNLVVTCTPIGNPPENDDCANPTEVYNGETSFSTTLATAVGPDAPLGCSTSNGPDFYNDVWFTYVAPCTGEITVGTCDSSFDSRIILYLGSDCPGAGTSPLACSDDDCGDDSQVSGIALEGSTILIRVGSPDDVEGDGTLQISCEPFDTPCEGDLDGDNKVNGSDLGLMLAQWGSDGSADLNDDGVVDGADLGLILAAWGDC